MCDEKKTVQQYRCPYTIDLEEYLSMQVSKESTHVKATVTYKSGRAEEFTAKLLKGERYPKAFSERVSKLRAFPTVEHVLLEKF